MNENDIVELLTGINQQAFALTSALDCGVIDNAVILKIRTAFAAAEKTVAKYLGCESKSVYFYGYDGEKLEAFTSNPGVVHTSPLDAILAEVKKEWKIIEGNVGLIDAAENRGKNSSIPMTGRGTYEARKTPNESATRNANVGGVEVIDEVERIYFSEGNIHVIGHKVSKEQGGGLLAFVRGKGPSELEKGLLSWVVNQLFTIYQNGLRGEALKVAGVKSAIGSIMARNGSHNIGSHVLAALSHNVSTMPEDRRLYRYIQHRMDYIATATTEFPAWRQPTLLVGSVLKTFLSQVHLLDYISRGEGLSAYMYEGNREQKNKIRFHIRRMNETGVDYEFIGHEHGEEGYDATKDITVAIPGGVIGHHAVFTIIENILRNAAKHEWLGSEGKGSANLDIHIDFRDDIERGMVTLQIWSGHGPMGNDTAENVVKKLNNKFKKPLVARGTKTLQAESWGLAEMRIAAGYLVGASIEQIAGIDDDPQAGQRGPLDLIRAVVVNAADKKKCIGFTLNVPKPKELLIVLSKNTPKVVRLDLPTLNRKLVRYGVYVKRNEDVEGAKDLSYSYVITDDLTRPNLPIRVIPTKSIVQEIGNIAAFLMGIQGEKNPGKEESSIETLLSKVHGYWIRQVLGWNHNNETEMTLSLDVKGGNTGNRKSLVTQADLLYFVLEHSIDMMLREYVDEAEKSPDKKTSLTTALFCFILLQIKNKRVNREKFHPKLCGEKKVDRQTIRDEIFKPQIEEWLKAAKDDEAVGTDFDKIDAETGERYISSTLADKLPKAGKPTYLYNLRVDWIFAEKTDELWKFAESYLNLAETLLTKDEAEVATLPDRYGRQYREAEVESAESEFTLWTLPISIKLSRVVDEKTYSYWRHGEGGEEKLRYLEPLSGSQSYIGHLEELEAKLMMRCEDLGVLNGLTRLAENAMIKMLIIDERVNKFANDHPEVKAIYDRIGIKVGDETSGEYIEALLRVMNKEKGRAQFDENILIIHQGILDKLAAAGRLSVKGDISKTITTAISRLQNGGCFKHVIITTGRGIPVNIPDNTRVLPFSVIESTLFRRYPEKLLLTDAIFNLLPIKRLSISEG